MKTFEEITRIKHVPGKNLYGLKVKTNHGLVGYWISQWSKGVFLSRTPECTLLTPVILDDIKEALEWEVNPDEAVNVDGVALSDGKKWKKKR